MKRHYYKICQIFCCLCLTFFLWSCQATNETKSKEPKLIPTLAPLVPFDNTIVDGILVSVADRAILLSDFQKLLYTATEGKTSIDANGKLSGGEITPEQAQQMLNFFINQKILEVKAALIGIEVSEEELTQKINDFLTQQHLTQTDLEIQLGKAGKSMKEYRSEFKSEILKQELIGKVISPLVTVTDDEINNFYLHETGQMKQITGAKLRSLMIQIPDNWTKKPLQTPKILEVTKAISKGEKFIDLVKKYSMASDATQTLGILPPKPLAQLPIELRKKLQVLKINQVVGPILIGPSAFFFEYLGPDFSHNSELKTNYASWKNKLLNKKLDERLASYLKQERNNIRINERPFHISR